MKGHPLPAHDAPAEHVRVLPQGPLGPPAPRGPRVEPGGARAGHNRALRVAQAVPGGEAHRAKMGDVHAGHALQGLTDPTVSWGTLGAHVAAAKGARGARVGGGVTVVSLVVLYFLPRLLRRDPAAGCSPSPWVPIHHKPFESARTARGLRARNRVGALHALRRAERRGAREKGGDQDQRTIRDWHHQRVQSRQRGLEWIPGFLNGS